MLLPLLASLGCGGPDGDGDRVGPPPSSTSDPPGTLLCPGEGVAAEAVADGLVDPATACGL